MLKEYLAYSPTPTSGTVPLPVDVEKFRAAGTEASMAAFLIATPAKPRSAIEPCCDQNFP